MADDDQVDSLVRLREVSHPSIYEINTWPWLRGLTDRQGGPVTLATVPDGEWADIAALGFDAVWLMGVWQRSPAGIGIAMTNEGLLADFDAALPGWTSDDVVGSPYCVRDYVVDDHLGGAAGLAAARSALAAHGLGLILDFVPNHVAPDHPWTSNHPERFVLGTDADLSADPTSFVRVGGAVFANGRDPYFPAWPDVVQLNAFAEELRAGATDVLSGIADQCDGVRCDMAMLMMNDVFARTWGGRVGPAPQTDYWPEVIGRVRESHPGFLFVAEAYWDLEWDLQQQGFDYCYDKRLYDRLLQEPAQQVHDHLLADLGYQNRLLRFVENHDEPRAASAFGPVRGRTAAVASLTQTGARLVHHGQLEGRRVRLPVFLGRFPAETPDADTVGFYRRLLSALANPTFHTGDWRLCDRSGWPGDDTYLDLVAWGWEGPGRWLVVVNLSERTARGHVRAPWAGLGDGTWTLSDPTTDQTFERSATELRDGLYVELEPWRWHLLSVELRTD